MANGFLIESPASRHAAAVASAAVGRTQAQKFTCPGTGTQEITEIGIWVSADAATTGVFHLAIFTDDAANGNPDVIVANSDSGELSISSTTVSKIFFTYSTKPQLTGGVVYWLAILPGDNNTNVDRLVTGGVDSLSPLVTYPTWPTAAQWDAGFDSDDDRGIYAVYVAAGGGSAEITPTIGSLSASGVASRNDRGVFVPTEVDV